MSLKQLFQVLWARKLLFLTVCALTLAAALAAGVLLPKKYVAEAAVVVDVNGNDPLSEKSTTPLQLQPAYIATQMDVIASRNVAMRVVEQQKLMDDPDFERAYQADMHGQGSKQNWLADRLLDSLTVRSSRSGNVIYLQYASASPERAARIVDAFADGYIQASLDLKVDPARRQSGWFDTQVDSLRTALEEAQKKLSAYQSQRGVIGTDDARLNVENARLEELSNQLVAAQSTMFETNARAEQMSEAGLANRPDEMSDVLKSPLLQNLKTELARAEAKFADVSQRFDRNHPQYMSAAAELTALQKKVAAEVENARGTVSREATIASQRVNNLKQALEQQRGRILALQHTQDDYAVLKRDVDSARAAYDTALQRSGQTRLESRIDHTNIAILNRAVVPMQPASPKPLLNLILAALLGPLLGAALCMLAEMFGRRVHTRDDLLDTGIAPILAEVPAGGLGWGGRSRSRSSSTRLHAEPIV
ncbi:MAG: chain length determinant protein EpsF [Steroidobacteraceae bacterium]